MADNLFIRIIAKLNQALSRTQIQKDVTQLERTPFIIRLQGQLDKSKTVARLRRDLQQAGRNQSINVNATVSRSSLERSLNEARQNINTSPIEIPVTADSAALRNAGEAQEDIINSGSGLRNVIQNYVNWNRVLDLIVQAMKKAVSTSSELAKAQTELQIVTGKSNSEMQSLMSGYNALAQSLSVTTTDITSAADEWLRTGKSISDTEKLITDSTILAKIGQLDTAEATKYLTSMMKGFKVETDDVIGIVDRLNAVDMAAAVTSGGLAEAMSKCANSADIANVSMDSLVGYIAAVKEVTQDSDSVVGNAFKSMFSRMGNVKLGKFIDENGEDISGEINNVEKLLSQFGISLRTSATEFRDFEDVIYDVGMAWDKFSSVEKNTIASTFGGTYQREKVTALFDDALKTITLGTLSEEENKFIVAKDLAESKLTENNPITKFNYRVAAIGQPKINDINNVIEQSGLFDWKYDDVEGLELWYKNDSTTVEGVIKNYEDIGKALDLLKSKFSSDELGGNRLFNQLTAEQTRLKTNIDAYNSAISDLNDNVAHQQILTALLGKELPSTQEEFDSFKDSLLASAESSEEWSGKFVGGTDSAKEAIISVLRQMPEFADFFEDEIPEGTSEADDGLQKVSKTISNLSDKLNDFMNAADTFSEALEKIITKTGLTFDELQKLLSFDPDLIYSVSKNEDGTYTVNKNDVISSANQYGESNNPYKEAYEKSQKEVSDLEKQLLSLEAMNNDPRISNSGLTQQIKDVKSQLTAAQQELDANKLLYDGYNDTIQKSVDTSYLKNIDTSFSNITTEVKDITRLFRLLK